MNAQRVNATVGSLLGFLHEGPQSGWDLVNTAERVIGDFWSLTRSQVYRELIAMADAGLIEPEATGPRDKQPYRLTPSGRATFQAWLSQMPAPELIRYPLLLTLAFVRFLDIEQVREFIDQHRTDHTARLRTYENQRDQAVEAGSQPIDLITLDFGIRYETAVLDWFDNLPFPLMSAPDSR